MANGRTWLCAATCVLIVGTLPAGAHAGERPLPDPTSVVQDPGSVVGGAAGTASGVVHDVAPTPDPKHVVDKVVGTVRDVVDRVIPESNAGSDTGSTAVAAARYGAKNDASDGARAYRHRRGAHQRTRSRSALHNHPVALAAPSGSSIVTRQAPHGAGARSLLDRVGSQIGHAAKQLAFPLALVLLVALFLILQKHIDRSDPKLASWTEHNDDELVVFE